MGQSDRSEASAHVHHPRFDSAKKKNLRMSGGHAADLLFLFKCLAELFAADIITDYAGRKRQASSEIYSLTFATEIMMRLFKPWDSNGSQRREYLNLKTMSQRKKKMGTPAIPCDFERGKNISMYLYIGGKG